MSSTAEKTVSETIEEGRRRRRERIIQQLEQRAESCFLCKWILEDIRANGALTGYPLDANGQAVFPRAGKVEHIRLEGFAIPD